MRDFEVLQELGLPCFETMKLGHVRDDDDSL